MMKNKKREGDDCITNDQTIQNSKRLCENSAHATLPANEKSTIPPKILIKESRNNRMSISTTMSTLSVLQKEKPQFSTTNGVLPVSASALAKAKCNRRPRSVSFSDTANSDPQSLLLGARHAATDSSPNTPDGHRGLTPLMVAARSGDDILVKKLLEKGADVNITDERGYDPLMYAVRDGHSNVVKTLLENGAKPSEYKKERSNLSHIMYAALNGHSKCISLLCQVDSDPNKPDLSGFTPLMAASQNGHVEAVRTLLGLRSLEDDSRRVLVNACDRQGLTAVAYASHSGLLEVVQILVTEGQADISITSRHGKSPLFWAVARGHSEVGQFLMKNGAKVCDAVRLHIIQEHYRQTTLKKKKMNHSAQIAQQQSSGSSSDVSDVAKITC